MQSFSHSKTLQDTTVASVIDRLQTLIPEHKFSILHIHHVDETLSGKGFDMEPYKIIEFCRAPAAHAVLRVDPDIGLFLPCKMIVRQIDVEVVVTTFLPSAITAFFPNAQLGELPQSVEKDIRTIVDEL